MADGHRISNIFNQSILPLHINLHFYIAYFVRSGVENQSRSRPLLDVSSGFVFFK